MPDDPRRDASDEHPLHRPEPPPAHDDQIAVLGVGQVHDPLVGLAFLAHGLDQRPLLLGKFPRVGKRVLAGLPERGPDVLDAQDLDLAVIGRDHGGDGYPALFINSKPERL